MQFISNIKVFGHRSLVNSLEFATNYFPRPLLFLVDLIVFLKKRISPMREIPKSFCTNIEWDKDFNINRNFFFEDKPIWISWLCLVKDWDDFLEEVVESHIVLCDQIIIMNNNSKDNTKKIALKLLSKYPDKIEYFENNYEIYFVWNPKFEQTKPNSIHSLAYQRNFVLSKAKFKYAMKLDDDNLIIPNKWKELRKYILEYTPNRYVYIYWINILNRNWRICIPESTPYCWRISDHWIFPISPLTYFYQIPWWWADPLNHPYLFKRFWESFIHLKFYKKYYWVINYAIEARNKYIQNLLSDKLEFNIWKYSTYFENEAEVKLILEKFNIKSKA